MLHKELIQKEAKKKNQKIRMKEKCKNKLFLQLVDHIEQRLYQVHTFQHV